MSELNDMFKDPKNAPGGLAGIYPPVYDIRNVIPKANVKISNNRPDSYGWVYKDEPTNMYLNPRMNSKRDAPHVIAHESEHILANDVDARYKGNKSDWDQEFLTQSKMKVDKLINYLNKSATNPTIPYYFKEKYNFPIKYFGQFTGNQFSLREQMAELSAAETTLKTDFSKDPFIMKNIFHNDKQFFDTYRATTGLRTNRLDANDLPPMTVRTK